MSGFGFPQLAVRSHQPELMDDRSIGGDELAEALRQLRVINRALGGELPVREGVARLWQAAGCPRTLTLVDVGAGSGDVNRALLRWATRRGIALRIVLVDIHPETCASAARYWRGEPRVQIVCSDLAKLAVNSADIVTASLFLHHFSSGELATVCATLARAARLGVVINDLHRHPLAWAGIWLLTRLFSRNRMIRNDAPLSVRRGFTARDFEHLRAALPDHALSYHWRPMFRWMIVVTKSKKGAFSGRAAPSLRPSLCEEVHEPDL